MTADEFRAGMAWDAALAVGQRVEVRWRWSGTHCAAAGEVVKLNAKSLRVRLDEPYRYTHEWTAPPVILVPRFMSGDWSGSEGAFPLSSPRPPEARR